jgi:hypothetical protein
MSTSKAKSSAVAVSLVAVLAVAAMVATPLLATPAYATYVKNPCEKDRYSDECKKFCKEYPKDPKCPKEDDNNKKKYPVCHNGKQIYVGSKNAQQKHFDNHKDTPYCKKY